MTASWQSGWAAAQAQWRSSARLRLATLVALSLFWLSLLSAASDRIDARLALATELRNDIERNKPLGRDKAWPARAEETAKQLALLRSMLWREPDLGLAEAALQDELRQLAARTGVSVRELSVARIADRTLLGLTEVALQDELRQLAARTGVGVRESSVARLAERIRSAGEGSASAPASSSAKYAELRARMVFEFRRDRVMALLAEMSQSARAIAVDRLLIRAAAQPPMAEMEVHIVVDTTQRGTP